MRLRTWVNDVGLTDGLQVLEVYQGTYETMDKTKDLVSSGIFPCKGASKVTDFVWETKGLTPGDYTVLFLLKNGKGEPVAMSHADLYLSDREIPLEDRPLRPRGEWLPRPDRDGLGSVVLCRSAVPALSHYGGPELHSDQPER